MSFDTLPFLIFYIALYVLYRSFPGPGWILLIASAGYYAFAGLHDTLLFVAVILANYAFSLNIRCYGRLALALALAFNAAVLGWFKYRGFLIGPGATAQSFTSSIAIPLGISFYTFQSMAYMVDIHRGHIIPERSLARFALFKSFFPQLVAGPIVRAHLLLPQVRRLFDGLVKPPRLVSFGLALCLLGVFKKIVLSDSLAPFTDEIFTLGPAGAAMAWLGAWLFAFQIYFDFSGYSDMAVGMAWLLGIRLPFNFATPYLATSPREFWQRWHITLSTWIRDYLYIPLGGSRGGGGLRQAAVLIGVMGLAGLWHGANWTFVAWGILWGLAIAVWRLFGEQLDTIPPGLRWLLTILIVLTLWVFFRAPDVGNAINYISVMWGGNASGTANYLSTAGSSLLVALGAAALLALQHGERFLAGRWTLLSLKRLDGHFVRGFIIAIIAWLVIMPKTNINPFIYFRF